MIKEESFYTKEQLQKLKEVLSKPEFYKKFNVRCDEACKEIDKMTEIDPEILRTPMTI